jgi:flagellar FliJ protein
VGSMAKFQYPLENLLKVKEKVEEQKKGEYGKALKKLEDEKQKKIELFHLNASAADHLRKQIQQKVSPLMIASYNRYISYLKKKIEEQDRNIRKAEQFSDIKREELLEALKQKKTLEVLKEKQHLEFQEEEKRREQKHIDEIVSFKYKNHHA